MNQVEQAQTIDDLFEAFDIAKLALMHGDYDRLARANQRIEAGMDAIQSGLIVADSWVMGRIRSAAERNSRLTQAALGGLRAVQTLSRQTLSQQQPLTTYTSSGGFRKLQIPQSISDRRA
jgi:hypothetical protein